MPLNAHVLNLVNFATFQVAWALCVFAGAHVWPAIIALVACLLLHEWTVQKQAGQYRFLRTPFHRVLYVVIPFGLLMDSAWVFAGVLEFPGAKIIPIWLVCLWICFATTLAHSLFWLSRFPLLAMVGGGVFGPLSYYLGTLSTEASLGKPLWFSVLCISVGWAIFIPIALLLIKRWVIANVAPSSSVMSV